jgi:plasmid stability protein
MVRDGRSVHRDEVAEIRIRQIPEAVRKALRQKALDEGVSMNALVIAILTKAVQKK